MGAGRGTVGAASVICAMSLAWACGGASGTGGSPLRIAFVGNSRIYYYDQPAMLEALARANGHAVETGMIVEGGATLADLIEGGALDSIRAGGWDVVVLNEQSTWGLTRYVEGLERVPEAPDGFFARVDSFARVAEAAGARLFLVAHPRHREMPEADGDALVRGFARAAAEQEGTEVVPEEVAWRIASERYPGIALYDPDGNHPTPVSALLSAVQMYEAVFGRLPDVVPTSVRGAWVELDDGHLRPDSVVELVSTDSATVAALRSVAREASERWPEVVARAHEAVESETDVPSLPPPEGPLDASALRGTWTGVLRLYPRFVTWPAPMTLDLAAPGGRWTVSLRVSFGGRPDDIVYPALPASDEGAYLQFVDPDGPNGGIVRYRVVPAGEDSLAGVAEFLTDGDIYGIGSLVLHRPEAR